MRLRVNNGRSSWFDKETYVEPIVIQKPLIVAIDQSKTNTAIIIGTKYKEVLHIAECSGNDKAFYEKAGNTTEFCAELEDYLYKLLGQANIIGFWQEEPIMKKRKWEKGEGYDFFKSQLVLTEVRATLLQVSRKLTGRPSKEVGNMDWKGVVLPDGYRGHGEKGSYRYLSSVDSKWLSYSNDVTDALCIYIYACSECKNATNIICSESEKADYKYNLSIVDKPSVPKSAIPFVASNKLTCEENAVYYINRSPALGYSKLDLMTIRLEELYKYAVDLYTMSDPHLIVKRL